VVDEGVVDLVSKELMKPLDLGDDDKSLWALMLVV
jgi:hypothetical protein